MALKGRCQLGEETENIFKGSWQAKIDCMTHDSRGSRAPQQNTIIADWHSEQKHVLLMIFYPLQYDI